VPVSKALNVSVAILNLTCNSTGSQWSSFRTWRKHCTIIPLQFFLYFLCLSLLLLATVKCPAVLWI